MLRQVTREVMEHSFKNICPRPEFTFYILIIQYDDGIGPIVGGLRSMILLGQLFIVLSHTGRKLLDVKCLWTNKRGNVSVNKML